jgi:hypothetical protein
MDFRKHFFCYLLFFGTLTSGFCAMGGQQPQQPQQASSSRAVSGATTNAAQADALYQEAVAAENRGSNDDAWKLYLRAAQKDSKAACAIVGHYYLYGNASMCNQNLDLANNYLQIAAALGDDGAAVDLVALQEMRAQKAAADKKAAEAEQTSMGWGDESDQEDDDKKGAEERYDGHPRLLTTLDAQQMQERFEEMLGAASFDWALPSTHESEEKHELTGSLASFATPSAKSTSSGSLALQQRSQAQQLEHKHARSDDEEKEDEGAAQERVKRTKPETNGTVNDNTKKTEQSAQKDSRGTSALAETDQDKAAREKTAQERDRSAVNASKIEEPAPRNTANAKKTAQDDSDSEDDIPLGQLIAKPTKASDVSKEKMQDEDSANATASVSSSGRGGSVASVRGRGRGRGLVRNPLRLQIKVPVVAAATGASTVTGINKQVVRINKWLLGVLNKYIAIANARVSSDVARASGDKKRTGRKAKTVRFDCLDEKKEAAIAASGVATFLDTHTQSGIPGELLGMMAAYAGVTNEVLQDVKIVVTFLLSTNKFRSNVQEYLEPTNHFDSDEDKTILHICQKNEKPPQSGHRGRAASERDGLRSRKTPFEALKSVLKADGVSFNTELYDAIKCGDLTEFKNALRSSDETLMYGVMDNDFDSSMYGCLIQGNEYSPLEVALHSLETSMQQLKTQQQVKKAQHGLYGFDVEQDAQERDQKIAQLQQVIHNQKAMLTTIVSYYDMPKLNKFLVYCTQPGRHYFEQGRWITPVPRISPRCLALTFPSLVEAGLIVTNDRYKKKKSDYGVVLLYRLFQALADAELQKDTAMRQALFAYLDAHTGEIDLNSGSEYSHTTPLGVLLSTLSAASSGGDEYANNRPLIGRLTTTMFKDVIFEVMRRGATMMNTSDPTALLYFLISHHEIVEDFAAVIRTLVAQEWVDINANRQSSLNYTTKASTALLHALDIDDNQKRVSMFKVLVGCGANMKIANEDGDTPLTYCGHSRGYYYGNVHGNPIMYSAAMVGDVELIKTLLRVGVNPTICFANGKTAATVADESGHKEAAAILATATEEMLKKAAEVASSAKANAPSTNVKQSQQQAVQPIPPAMPMAQQQPMVQMPQQSTMLSATQLEAIQRSLANVVQRTAQQQQAPTHVVQQQEQKRATGVLSVRVDSEGIHYLRDGQPVNESDLTTGERLQLDGMLSGQDVEMPQQPAQSEPEFVPSWETLLLEQQREQAQPLDQQQPADQEDDVDDQPQTDEQAQQPPANNNMDTHEKS